MAPYPATKVSGLVSPSKQSNSCDEFQRRRWHCGPPRTLPENGRVVEGTKSSGWCHTGESGGETDLGGTVGLSEIVRWNGINGEWYNFLRNVFLMSYVGKLVGEVNSFGTSPMIFSESPAISSSRILPLISSGQLILPKVSQLYRKFETF